MLSCVRGVCVPLRCVGVWPQEWYDNGNEVRVRVMSVDYAADVRILWATCTIFFFFIVLV
jgi:hypothetical protein